jgi:tripartite-type tricarboxylate transporter receptor subunit TctC
MKIRAITACLLVATATFMAPAHGEQWPTKAIKWIVPYQAGSAPDGVTRVVAAAMSSGLAQPIVIENRAGASGNLGAQYAARSPADGYTWVYSSSVMAGNMKLYKSPGYDVLKDFTHISTFGASDSLLVVNPASGIKSVHELIEQARASPGKLNFGSSGLGTPSHLGVIMMMRSANFKAEHVPYRGAHAIVMALLGKEIDFGLPILGVALSQARAGELVALAVAAKQRNPSLPDVPTLEEAGVREVALESFGGLSVPAGTPAAIVSRIHEALSAALNDPAIVQRLENMGMSKVKTSTPEAFAQLLQGEIDKTEHMMLAAGIDSLQ